MKWSISPLIALFLVTWLIPAQAGLGSWANSFRNAVRSTLGFRLMAPQCFPSDAFKSRASSLAFKLGIATSGVNCRMLQQELAKEAAKEEHPQPLKAQFSCRLQGFLKCKKNDANCLTISNALQHIAASSKGPFVRPGIEGSVTQFAIDENRDSEHINDGINFAAHGTITCPTGDQRCNNSLYLAARCAPDFSQCLKAEVNGAPRTQKCASVFNLFGFDRSSLDSFKKQTDSSFEYGIHDIDCTVTLDDENSHSRWF